VLPRKQQAMIRLRKSDDYEPIGWAGQYPIHVATLLVILFSAAMVALALLRPDTRMAVVDALEFRSNAIQTLQLWRFASYAFLNGPSIWFVLNMFFLVWFGREVEKFIGRRAFLLLCGILLVFPPCVLSALDLWFPTFHEGENILSFSVFLAFAAIYPGVEFFFGIKVKWLALIFLAIYSLAALSDRNVKEMAVLWSSAAAAFLYIDYVRGFPTFDRLKRVSRPAVTVRRPRRIKPPEEDVVGSIDPLLDKIAKEGLASLSPREREMLERAREALIKKQKRSSFIE